MTLKFSLVKVKRAQLKYISLTKQIPF